MLNVDLRAAGSSRDPCKVDVSLNTGEQGMGKSRLEAFSDGVIAIIITIMVLELKVPHGESIAALAPLIPVFLSYALSFIYLGIYWNNHHHMLHACQRGHGIDALGKPASPVLAVAGAVCDGVDG
jgi:hypothetical protein